MTALQVGEIAALATALLWTLSAVAWTLAGRHIGALAVSFVRLLIACVPLMITGQLTRGLALPTDANARTWVVLGLSGFFGFFVSDLCLFQSFMLIGPRLALLIQSLIPPLTALFAALAGGAMLGRWQWTAMGITLAGIAWVLMEQPATRREQHQWRAHRQGIGLAVLAAVVQSAAHVLAHQGIGDYAPVPATLLRILAAMLGYLVLITVCGRWHRIRASLQNRRAMLTLTAGAMVGPVAGVVLYMVAMQRCLPAVVTIILAVVPVLILPFSIFLFGERVSLRAAGGALLSFVGVALLFL